MSIYKIQNNRAAQLNLNASGFGNEFGLRDFFAENDNLYNILGIKFLSKEYQIPNGRIDTLGIDENGSPVIIEYKWKENDDVLSQGLFYLDWLRNNKPHFELIVRDILGNETEITWSKPRVVLIAQGFNRYIKSAVCAIQGVELKTYNVYEGDILQIENEYSPIPESQRRIRPLESNENTEEIEIYNLNYHLTRTLESLRSKFLEIQEMLLQLPDVEELSEQISGITYRTTRSFVKFEFKVNSIRILVRQAKYETDDNHLVQDITNNKWGYLGMINFTNETNKEEIFDIIKASYNSTL